MKWKRKRALKGDAADPYLDWALTTDFSGHAAAQAHPAKPDPWIAFLVEGTPPEPGENSFVPPIYRQAASDRSSTFFSLWVRKSQANALFLNKGIKHAQMALPLGQSPAQPNLSAEREPAAASQGREQRQGGPRRLVLGVVDRGIAFLNQSFRRGRDPDQLAQTRVLALWDQGHAKPERDEHWRVPEKFLYGRCLWQKHINALISESQTPADELAQYHRLGYLLEPDGLIPEHLHGTHVADTLCGLPELWPLSGTAKPDAKSDGEGDAASTADLVFVNLPEQGEFDTTGASSDAYVLDAVRFILDAAGPDSTVLINLSVGANAGPHNGTSLIESALDSIIQHRENTAIVIAAGNGRESRWAAKGKLASDPSNSKASCQAQLVWRTLPDDVTDSFLEVWLRPKKRAELTDLQIRCTGPGGFRSPAVGVNEVAELHDDEGNPVARLAFRASTSLGKGPMALLALAPSAALPGPRTDAQGVPVAPRAISPAGLWAVEISHAKGVPVALEAWVQRDEPPDGLEIALQSELVALQGLSFEQANTMSSLSSGKATISVGSLRLDGSVAPYSAQSGPLPNEPEEREKHLPDGYAVADLEPTSLGLIAAACASSSFFAMSGTSVAAPRFGRRWANWLKLQKKSLPSATLKERYLKHLGNVENKRPQQAQAPANNAWENRTEPVENPHLPQP